MEIIQALQMCEDCLVTAKLSGLKNGALYLQNGHVLVERLSQIPKKITIIRQLSSLDISAGLTSKEWNEVEDRLRFLKQKGYL